MKIKRIIIILLILFVMGGGIYMAISIFKGRQLSQSNLLTCRYTVGGGMLGGFNSATIRKNNDGTVNYITESAQTHADRIVTKTYVVMKI